MRACFSLLLVAAAALPATLGRATEVEHMPTASQARLTFADGWALRLSESDGVDRASDGQRPGVDPRDGARGAPSVLGHDG